MHDLKDKNGESLCWKDCLIMKKVLEKYGVNDYGPNDEYLMNDVNYVMTVRFVVNIKRRIRDCPEKKFLIVYVLAGHGMLVGCS